MATWGGKGDPRDWSSIELYRTETLLARGSNDLDGTESLVLEAGIGCSTSTGSSLFATKNGWYDLKVSSSVHAPYTIEYEVAANDALSGKDAPNTPHEPYFISAVPRTLDPQQTIIYKGSRPNRADQPFGPDQDWYRIGTNLAALPDPTNTRGPAFGLLRVTFNPDCNGSTYTFDFYSADGTSRIGAPTAGCGLHEKACVTSGLLPVTVRFATVRDRGTGYDFTADLVPLHLVDLNDGVPRPHLNPSEPFCDLVTPALLQAAGWAPGTDAGFVNQDGVVVASTHVN